MNKFYTFALILSAGLFMASCETESVSESASERTILNPTGKQLTIMNNSDFTMRGMIYCHGAEGNIAASPNILVKGSALVPANYEVTYKNFVEVSNSAYRVSPWHVTINEGLPVSYTASHTNQVYGQLYNPAGTSQSKYANFRYLKVELTTTIIPGFTQPIVMDIELPAMSSNNSGSVMFDLSPYGLHKYLLVTQESFINASGNTVLKIDSQQIDESALDN